MSSGRTSRRKGASGEREVRDIFRRHGFHCVRDGRFEGDLNHDVPGVWVEVKRRETLAIPAWLRQAEHDAPEGTVPWVVFRRSKEPWRVVMPLEEALRLKRLEALLERLDREVP